MTCFSNYIILSISSILSWLYRKTVDFYNFFFSFDSYANILSNSIFKLLNKFVFHIFGHSHVKLKKKKKIIFFCHSHVKLKKIFPNF